MLVCAADHVAVSKWNKDFLCSVWPGISRRQLHSNSLRISHHWLPGARAHCQLLLISC